MRPVLPALRMQALHILTLVRNMPTPNGTVDSLQEWLQVRQEGMVVVVVQGQCGCMVRLALKPNVRPPPPAGPPVPQGGHDPAAQPPPCFSLHRAHEVRAVLLLACLAHQHGSREGCHTVRRPAACLRTSLSASPSTHLYSSTQRAARRPLPQQHLAARPAGPCCPRQPQLSPPCVHRRHRSNPPPPLAPALAGWWGLMSCRATCCSTSSKQTPPRGSLPARCGFLCARTRERMAVGPALGKIDGGRSWRFTFLVLCSPLFSAGPGREQPTGAAPHASPAHVKTPTRCPVLSFPPTHPPTCHHLHTHKHIRTHTHTHTHNHTPPLQVLRHPWLAEVAGLIPGPHQQHGPAGAAHTPTPSHPIPGKGATATAAAAAEGGAHRRVGSGCSEGSASCFSPSTPTGVLDVLTRWATLVLTTSVLA